MRRSVFEVAGGSEAFVRLVAAHHARCLADDLLNHPFSHGVKPDHVERLGAYWAQVFGGPATFSEAYGGQSAMISPHAECEVMSYSPRGSVVPEGLAVPRWSWHGLQP